MGTLALNKSSLKSERDRLKTFQRFLPSLDLKRQQLMVEFKNAERTLGATRREIDEFVASLEGLLPLLGATAMDLSGYVGVEAVVIGEENVLGVRLPVLHDIEFGVEEYSTLAKPFWVDTLVDCVQQMSELRIREQVHRERVARLDEAVRRITQRVNLFEKVLIPTAQKSIHRIHIYLADAERAAVVRSKIVKAKHQREARLAGATLMAITPVNKVTLYGIADQKEAVLDGLQSLGCVHLVNLTPGSGEGQPAPGFSVEAHEALHYLRACPTQRRQVKDRKDFDFAEVEREALEIRGREQELQDERDFVLKAIDALEPWGEFRVPAEEELGGAQLWFYVVPHYRMEALRELDLVWQAVARDERFDYVVVVDANEPRGMPVSPEDLDLRSLSHLTQRMEEVELELEDLHWRRVELTRWCSLMEHTMAEADDRAVLEHAGTTDLGRVTRFCRARLGTSWSSASDRGVRQETCSWPSLPRSRNRKTIHPPCWTTRNCWPVVRTPSRST